MTTSPYVPDFNPAAFRRKRYDDLRAALDSGVSGIEGGIKAYDTENAAKEKEDYLRGVKKTEMDLESKRVAMNQAREDRIAAGATPRKGLGALQDALDAERLKKLQTENDDLPPDPSKDNSVDMAQAFSEAANPSSAPPATGPARLRDAATKKAPVDDTPSADAVVNPAPSADVESALNNFDTITAPAFQGTGKAPESVDEKIKDQKLITATNKNRPKAAVDPNAPKSAKQRTADAKASIAEEKAKEIAGGKQMSPNDLNSQISTPRSVIKNLGVVIGDVPKMDTGGRYAAEQAAGKVPLIGGLARGAIMSDSQSGFEARIDTALAGVNNAMDRRVSEHTMALWKKALVDGAMLGPKAYAAALRSIQAEMQAKQDETESNLKASHYLVPPAGGPAAPSTSAGAPPWRR